MNTYFVDTNVLLEKGSGLFDDNTSKILVSGTTLRELENIKTSLNRDPETKYQARKALHALDTHLGVDCEAFYVTDGDFDYIQKQYPVLSKNDPDSRIIATALFAKKNYYPNLVFWTKDLACKTIAYVCKLDTKYDEVDDTDYRGYTILEGHNADEIAGFYEKLWAPNMERIFHPYENQYFIIRDEYGHEIDGYKYTEQGMQQVEFRSFDSRQLGKIKPKDMYQRCAMDSLYTNRFTILRGKAGSGKSLLALSYLFQELEAGRIHKIIIFCNTVAVRDAAKLGYYPGDKIDKLLDSQIGNFLSSKLGDREGVLELIDRGQLELMPMSDIRGFDTTGMKAGVYITEGQNLTVDMMKLAIQRIGEDCILIVDGDDMAQVDMSIYGGTNNGMKRAIKTFSGEDYFGTMTLENIHRSRMGAKAELM